MGGALLVAGVWLGMIFSARGAEDSTQPITAVEAGSLPYDGNLSYRYPGASALFNWVGLETNNLGVNSLGVDKSGYYERRNYFRFNLPARPADPLMRVKQAVLILEMTSGSFNTPQEFETLVFRQASAFTFDALGTGLEFGRHEVDTKSLAPARNYNTEFILVGGSRAGVRFTLNNKAVFAANSKLGTSFDFGGALDSFNKTKNGQGIYFSEYLFDGNTPSNNPGKLELTIGVNAPPTVSILTPATVNSCEVILNATVADAERDVLTVTWSEIVDGIPVPLASYIYDPDYIHPPGSAEPNLSAPTMPTVHLELGPHTLQIVVSDVYGGQTTVPITINVVDQTPPVISNLSFLEPQPDGSIVAIERLPNAQGLVSPGLILEATNPNGEMVTDAMITAHGWDDCDLNPTIISTPALPYVFPLGTKLPDGTWTSTNVQFQAFDSTGIPPNPSSVVTTTVTVRDTTAPAFDPDDPNFPVDFSASAQDAAGALLLLNMPQVTDVADPAPLVTVFVNGTLYSITDTIPFPLGKYPAVVKVTDASGNSSDVTIMVEILDGPPEFDFVPADRTVDATSANGVYLLIPLATASDKVDGGPVAVTSTANTPPAETFFPIGYNVVTFTAEDSKGQKAYAAMSVTVRQPQFVVFIRHPGGTATPQFNNWPAATAGQIYGFVYSAGPDGDPLTANDNVYQEALTDQLQWSVTANGSPIGGLVGPAVGSAVTFQSTAEAFSQLRTGAIEARIGDLVATQAIAVTPLFVSIRHPGGTDTPEFTNWPAGTSGLIYGFVFSAGLDGNPATEVDNDYQPDKSAQLQWSVSPDRDAIGSFVGATMGSAVTFASAEDVFPDPLIGSIEARLGNLVATEYITVLPIDITATLTPQTADWFPYGELLQASGPDGGGLQLTAGEVLTFTWHFTAHTQEKYKHVAGIYITLSVQPPGGAPAINILANARVPFESPLPGTNVRLLTNAGLLKPNVDNLIEWDGMMPAGLPPANGSVATITITPYKTLASGRDELFLDAVSRVTSRVENILDVQVNNGTRLRKGVYQIPAKQTIELRAVSGNAGGGLGNDYDDKGQNIGQLNNVFRISRLLADGKFDTSFAPVIILNGFDVKGIVQTRNLQIGTDGYAMTAVTAGLAPGRYHVQAECRLKVDPQTHAQATGVGIIEVVATDYFLEVKNKSVPGNIAVLDGDDFGKGNSRVTFEVKHAGGAVPGTTYTWLSGPPPGVSIFRAHPAAKYEPKIVFDAPNGSKTGISGPLYWYSDRDISLDACNPRKVASYLLTCTITIPGKLKPEVVSEEIQVYAPIGASTFPEMSLPTEFSNAAVRRYFLREGGLFKKEGDLFVFNSYDGGGITRTVKTDYNQSFGSNALNKELPELSQFREKFRIHENIHVKQFDGTGAPDMSKWFTRLRAIEFVNARLKGVKRTSIGNAEDILVKTINEYAKAEKANFIKRFGAHDKKVNDVRATVERPAYKASDGEHPQVLFQGPCVLDTFIDGPEQNVQPDPVEDLIKTLLPVEPENGG